MRPLYDNVCQMASIYLLISHFLIKRRSLRANARISGFRFEISGFQAYMGIDFIDNRHILVTSYAMELLLCPPWADLQKLPLS